MVPSSSVGHPVSALSHGAGRCMMRPRSRAGATTPQRYFAHSSSSPCIVMPNQETPPLHSAPGFCVGSAVICSRTAQQTTPKSSATASTRMRAAQRLSKKALTNPAAATVTIAQVRTLDAAETVTVPGTAECSHSMLAPVFRQRHGHAEERRRGRAGLTLDVVGRLHHLVPLLPGEEDQRGREDQGDDLADDLLQHDGQNQADD